MLGRWSEIPRLQSDFYRDKLRKILNWLIISVAFMILLLLAIFFVLLRQPPQQFFANTTEGKILLMPEEHRGS